MKQYQGILFPDHKTHFPEWMAEWGEIFDGRGTSQIAKLRAAVAFCQQRRVAIDIGAHVGLWSMQLSKMFIELQAFSPLKNIVCVLTKTCLNHGNLISASGRP
ncbi:hypothetical protein NZK32_00475 [Cyanobium sp. FGCU-52]|nr:hypothetical protein [Cyanobium sp. FGCU52]